MERMKSKPKCTTCDWMKLEKCISPASCTEKKKPTKGQLKLFP